MNAHGFCDGVMKNHYKMCLQIAVGIALHSDFNSMFSA